MKTLSLTDDEIRLVIWGLEVAEDEYIGTSLRGFAAAAKALAENVVCVTGLDAIGYQDLADERTDPA